MVFSIRNSWDCVSRLAGAGAEACVLELADGLNQRETAALLRSPLFRDRIDGVIFAHGGLQVIVALRPDRLTVLEQVTLDGPVLGFALYASLIVPRILPRTAARVGARP